MKIAYSSDLHQEFGTQEEIMLQEPVDVLVLAGDIAEGKKLVETVLANGNCMAKHIVFVCGNHEYYGSRIDKVHRRIQEDIDKHNGLRDKFSTVPFVGLHWLNDSSVVIDGITFAGGTCWTDFELEGNSHIAMFDAGQFMNDYRRIKIHDAKGNYRRLIPGDALRMNLNTKYFLFEEISKAQAEDRLDKMVVVTHHAPTHRSIDPDFVGNQLNAAYANNWGNQIAYGGPNYWFHGHMHCPNDYMCGETRVLSNPWGYPGQNKNPGFKIVTIG